MPEQSDARWEPPETPMLLARLRWRPQPTTRWLIVPDPVPEAAVEAGSLALCEKYGYDPVEFKREWDDDSAAVLAAALDTGTLIAVPQDEQGRRELVQRAAVACKREFGDGVPVNGSEWREAASAVLQALGLLPEQEEANG